jgi:hypothetical protein
VNLGSRLSTSGLTFLYSFVLPSQGAIFPLARWLFLPTPLSKKWKLTGEKEIALEKVRLSGLYLKVASLCFLCSYIDSPF